MKPILFNTEMVRAILDDRKTVTWRVIKYKHSVDPTKTLDDFIGTSDPQLLVSCAPYKTDDVLWVRETWFFEDHYYDESEGSALYRYVYRASRPDYPVGVPGWRPSIHMPKEAARLFLRVTGVRVERLQDMNLDDFLKEGVCLLPEAFNDPDNAYHQAKRRFSAIWNSTIKKPDLDCYGWNANPWVWVIEFERIDKATAKGGLNFEQM